MVLGEGPWTKDHISLAVQSLADARQDERALLHQPHDECGNEDDSEDVQKAAL